MKRGLQFWKQEVVHLGKKLFKDFVVYAIKSIISNMIEEHLIKRPLKKIFSINLAHGWDDDVATA